MEYFQLWQTVLFVMDVFEPLKKIVGPGDQLSFQIHAEFVKILLLGNRLNASGEGEAEVTARARIEWIIFGECGNLLYRRKL